MIFPQTLLITFIFSRVYILSFFSTFMMPSFFIGRFLTIPSVLPFSSPSPNFACSPHPLSVSLLDKMRLFHLQSAISSSLVTPHAFLHSIAAQNWVVGRSSSHYQKFILLTKKKKKIIMERKINLNKSN